MKEVNITTDDTFLKLTEFLNNNRNITKVYFYTPLDTYVNSVAFLVGDINNIVYDALGLQNTHLTHLPCSRGTSEQSFREGFLPFIQILDKAFAQKFTNKKNITAFSRHLNTNNNDIYTDRFRMEKIKEIDMYGFWISLLSFIVTFPNLHNLGFEHRLYFNKTLEIFRKVLDTMFPKLIGKRYYIDQYLSNILLVKGKDKHKGKSYENYQYTFNQLEKFYELADIHIKADTMDDNDFLIVFCFDIFRNLFNGKGKAKYLKIYEEAFTLQIAHDLAIAAHVINQEPNAACILYTHEHYYDRINKALRNHITIENIDKILWHTHTPEAAKRGWDEDRLNLLEANILEYIDPDDHTEIEELNRFINMMKQMPSIYLTSSVLTQKILKSKLSPGTRTLAISSLNF